MRESLGRRRFAELLENALATAMGLFAIILMFGPVSGAHFNPAVSLVDAAFGGLRRRHALACIPAQIGGCFLGAVVANPAISIGRMFSNTFAGIAPTSVPG